MDTRQRNNLTMPQMLVKLDELYVRENVVIKEANRLWKEYNQLQEDKEFLQNMIMYLSNKQSRNTQGDING